MELHEFYCFLTCFGLNFLNLFNGLSCFQRLNNVFMQSFNVIIEFTFIFIISIYIKTVSMVIHILENVTLLTKSLGYFIVKTSSVEKHLCSTLA